MVTVTGSSLSLITEAHGHCCCGQLEVPSPSQVATLTVTDSPGTGLPVAAGFTGKLTVFWQSLSGGSQTQSQ